MLNLKFIQENKDTVIRKLAVKNFDAKELVEKIIALDNERIYKKNRITSNPK